MKVQLPSGRTIDIVGRGEPRARRAEEGKPLFDEVRAAAASGDVLLKDERGRAVAIGSLALGDFHALRALLTNKGWLYEEPVEITCRNCGEPITHAPCAALPLGPFVDRELSDPELDQTLPFGEPHDAPDLGAVVLAPITADVAAPLHAALGRDRLVISGAIVRAMGIARIGAVSAPAPLARILRECSDDAWTAVTELFLEAHYPPRLFSIALCPSCGARNDVDAPYDREFEPGVDSSGQRRLLGKSNEESFASFEEFDRAARQIADRLLAGAEGEGVTFVVEGGVAACDDGGDELLGSYVPGYAGDMTTPSRAPEITLFYRTFRAMWLEEGAYDWRAEIDETIAHELEHHVAELAGHDPMDEEERREIAREQARILGRGAVARGQIRAMIADFLGFLRRTWPIWLLLLVATLAVAYGDVR